MCSKAVGKKTCSGRALNRLHRLKCLLFQRILKTLMSWRGLNDPKQRHQHRNIQPAHRSNGIITTMNTYIACTDRHVEPSASIQFRARTLIHA